MTVVGSAGNDWNPDYGHHSELLAHDTCGCNGLLLLQGAWDLCGYSTRCQTTGGNK